MASKDMLINHVPGEECRIAIVESGRLEELYAERASADIHVGNIYRGRVTNVEPSIQAAFVDFGLDRNGFLHISDLHPRYFGGDETTERVGKRTPRKSRPPIQQAVKRGDTVLVQVLKEGIGTKGPTLTSYLSIPGRFLVMMPDMERHGVSRKVDDEDKRREMRRILDELQPPEEFGFIVRTAGIGRTKTELKRDLAYLQRLWKTMSRRLKTGRGPIELYRESDLTIRTLRDVLSSEVERIIVDDLAAAQRAHDFLRIAMPRGHTKVYHYNKPIPLFDAFDIERQIADITSREVKLPSGGSLVIDSTEALVAVDVNSGKMRDNKDAETTAYKTNSEAVAEIARQLRLRDLGGLIVLDLIDMYQHSHRRDIEKQIKEHLKADRARSKVTRINDLGLLSMTRQRMRPSLKKALHQVCHTCDGHGLLRTDESVALDAMRQLAVVLSADRVVRAELTVTPTVGALLLNRKRRSMHQLEEQLGKRVEVGFDCTMRPDEVRLLAFDDRGVKLDVTKLPAPKPPKLAEDEEVVSDPNAEPADPMESETQTDTLGAETESPSEQTGKKRRRRRRRRKKNGEEAAAAEQTERDDSVEPAAEQAEAVTEDESDEARPTKRRRRRRGGRRRRRKNGEEAATTETTGEQPSPVEVKAEPQPEPAAETKAKAAEPKTKKKTTKKKTTKKKTAKKTAKKTTKKKTAKRTTKKKASPAEVAEQPAEVVA